MSQSRKTKNYKNEVISFTEGNFKDIEELPSFLHEITLPLLLIKGDEFRVIGTAFVINTQAALVVTAAHCIYEAYGEMDGDRQIAADEGILHIGYFSQRDGQYFGGVAQVVQLSKRPHDVFAKLSASICQEVEAEF